MESVRWHRCAFASAPIGAWHTAESRAVTSRHARRRPTGFGALSQFIRADDYRGKRVRFSAYVKTHDVSAASSGAGLWMRVDGNGGILAFDNMQNRPIMGTTDWKLVSVVLDVPNDASRNHDWSPARVRRRGVDR